MTSQGQKMSEEAEEKQLQKTEQRSKRINKGKQKNTKKHFIQQPFPPGEPWLLCVTNNGCSRFD